MGQNKRKRTAQKHMTEVDRDADEAIQEHNFHKLVQEGVIVEERTEKCQKTQQ